MKNGKARPRTATSMRSTGSPDLLDRARSLDKPDLATAVALVSVLGDHAIRRRSQPPMSRPRRGVRRITPRQSILEPAAERGSHRGIQSRHPYMNGTVWRRAQPMAGARSAMPAEGGIALSQLTLAALSRWPRVERIPSGEGIGSSAPRPTVWSRQSSSLKSPEAESGRVRHRRPPPTRRTIRVTTRRPPPPAAAADNDTGYDAGAPSPRRISPRRRIRRLPKTTGTSAETTNTPRAHGECRVARPRPQRRHCSSSAAKPTRGRAAALILQLSDTSKSRMPLGGIVPLP